MASSSSSAARSSPATTLQIPIKVSGVRAMVGTANGLPRCGERLLPPDGNGEEAGQLRRVQGHLPPDLRYPLRRLLPHDSQGETVLCCSHCLFIVCR